MTTSLLEELQQAGLRLLLLSDGRMRWEAAHEPPPDLISKARAGKDDLRLAVLRQKDAILKRYHGVEEFLEKHLWEYLRSNYPPAMHGKYVSALADIDLIEERLRQQFGATGCLSRHGRCTAEQVESRLCCEACRKETGAAC